MKKILLLLLINLSLLPLFSCKSDLKGLEYVNIQSTDNFLQGSVKKRNGGDRVLWFQVYNHIKKESIKVNYKNRLDKVGEYPALINGNNFIWVLVNNRIEIRIMAENKVRDFQKTEKLKKFFLSFDLKGLEKIKEGPIAGIELKKYLPKLD